MQTVAYVGWWRTTEVEVAPEEIAPGVGKVPCFECEGDGIFGKFLPEPDDTPCVCCKGKGLVLISI